MGRRLSEYADLILVAALVIGGLYILRAHEIKSEDAIATMVGALLGSAALFLGNWIGRWNERRRAMATLGERVRKLKALVAAELVNLAAGLIGALDYMEAAITAAEAGGSVPTHDDLTGHSPRQMPFTDNLGSELLIMQQRDIDVLATLRSNLSITRLSMDEVTAGRRQFGLLAAQQLASGIRHDMGVLAEAFDEIAPTRKAQATGCRRP